MGVQRFVALVCVLIGSVCVGFEKWDAGTFWVALAIINQLWAMDNGALGI